MIIKISYAFAFFIEALISLFYFEYKLERKSSKNIIFILSIIFGTVSFISSQLENFQWLNATTFFICNFVILYFCYSTDIKTCLFNTFILLSLMITTELIVYYILSATIFDDTAQIFHDSFFILILTALSKLIYFIAIYLFSKFSIKERTMENITVSFALSIMPISSVVLMVTIFYLCVVYSIKDIFKIILGLSSIFILLANIVVFYIHELTIKTNRKYTEVLLEQQKERDIMAYYELLKTQNENSRVIIHDITRHLNSIKQLASDNNNTVSEYISNIVQDFNIYNPVEYCNNYLVNLITHRYYELCQKKNINFDINIINTNIDFMKEPDITALIDNLLENAIESAEISDKKFIDFSINVRNNNFLIIKISNSCDKKPKEYNEHIISSKENSNFHGFGIISIKRVVKKYNGNIEMNFFEELKTFEAIVIFKIPIAT